MITKRWQSRLIWTLLIASLAFNAGIAGTIGVQAYRTHVSDEDCPPPGKPGERGPRFHERLGLTPEQKTELRAGMDRLLERDRELLEQLQTQVSELVDLMAAPTPDREGITEQIHTIASLRERLDLHLAEHFLDVRQILEPAQYEAFDELIRRAFVRGGRGPHGRDHGQGGKMRSRREMRGASPPPENQPPQP